MTFAPKVKVQKKRLKRIKMTLFFQLVIQWQHTKKQSKLLERAKHVTHLYNAATPFQHREPGVFGAAWLNDALHTEMIVDGTHSSSGIGCSCYRMKGNERFYLITDAMRAKGTPEGEYDLGRRKK